MKLPTKKKTACSECRLSHKACNKSRPCDRCMALGLEACCIDQDDDPRLKESSALPLHTIVMDGITLQAPVFPSNNTSPGASSSLRPVVSDPSQQPVKRKRQNGEASIPPSPAPTSPLTNFPPVDPSSSDFVFHFSIRNGQVQKPAGQRKPNAEPDDDNVDSNHAPLSEHPSPPPPPLTVPSLPHPALGLHRSASFPGMSPPTILAPMPALSPNSWACPAVFVVSQPVDPTAGVHSIARAPRARPILGELVQPLKVDSMEFTTHQENDQDSLPDVEKLTPLQLQQALIVLRAENALIKEQMASMRSVITEQQKKIDRLSQAQGIFDKFCLPSHFMGQIMDFLSASGFVSSSSVIMLRRVSSVPDFRYLYVSGNVAAWGYQPEDVTSGKFSPTSCAHPDYLHTAKAIVTTTEKDVLELKERGQHCVSCVFIFRSPTIDYLKGRASVGYLFDHNNQAVYRMIAVSLCP